MRGKKSSKGQTVIEKTEKEWVQPAGDFPD